MAILIESIKKRLLHWSNGKGRDICIGQVVTVEMVALAKRLK